MRGSFAASGAARALLGPLSMSMLCALLDHSAADVQISAAKTMAAAARAVPAAGISFLPVLVHHLQRLSMQTPTSGMLKPKAWQSGRTCRALPLELQCHVKLPRVNTYERAYPALPSKASMNLHTK